MVHVPAMTAITALTVKMKPANIMPVLQAISKPVVGNVFLVMQKVGMLLLKANALSADHSVKCAVVHVF